MQSFTFDHPTTADAALRARMAAGDAGAYIAGGTDMIQLMKANVAGYAKLVDLERLDLRAISADDRELRLGALATMADVAAHPEVTRRWTAISEALLLAASPQIRNMGTVGGNLLQRTRCTYFRDTGFTCNKRVPGSGCPAIQGDNRELAIFGGSAQCIATHPSDMPVALVAMDATVDLHAPDGGTRTIRLAELYRLPGETPHLETNLRPGELITAIRVPAMAGRSTYLKVRDRTSYAYALSSAAVVLDVQGGTIRDARVAFGGVGTMPWRAPAVEAALRGKRADDAAFREAAAHAADGAQPASLNAYKVKLVQRVALRAMQAVAA
jgi:xanthine dehydrogenase YagS FAD-binding subunit